MDLNELGAFLKSRRDRLSPADVGLTATPRRRVPGLRRDEVATLAGASVDYYVQLEQGRGAQPSEQMLAALARALRLTLDERHHVYRLAARPVPDAWNASPHVEPGLLELLDRLDGVPAQIMSELSVVLAQNRLAAALLGPEPQERGVRRSVLYRWFTDPEARSRYHPDEHAHQSRVFVSDLRAATSRRQGDPFAAEIVTSLGRGSEEFAALWAKHEVAVRRNDHKRLLHPSVGELELDCFSLRSEDGAQRLLWFTAPRGSVAAERLELLDVVGDLANNR
jgi:transcriptional regulator with XRE-family HTH domain